MQPVNEEPRGSATSVDGVGKQLYIDAVEKAREVSKQYFNAKIALFYDLDKEQWTLAPNENTILMDYVSTDSHHEVRESNGVAPKPVPNTNVYSDEYVFDKVDRIMGMLDTQHAYNEVCEALGITKGQMRHVLRRAMSYAGMPTLAKLIEWRRDNEWSDLNGK